jgi:mono/diheme cytochrome c family protein
MALSVGLAVPAMAQDARAAGEKVYAEQKCSLCHAIAGKGNAKGPLDEVDGLVAYLSAMKKK